MVDLLSALREQRADLQRLTDDMKEGNFRIGDVDKGGFLTDTTEKEIANRERELAILDRDIARHERGEFED